MSQIKKSARLRISEDRRRASKAKRVENRAIENRAEAAERLAIKSVLGPHDIDSRTKKIIEDLAVEYAPALKRLADR